MTRADLLRLAERVEREEPSRGLDAAIWGASGQFGSFEDFMGGDDKAPRYTTSLDAAASLVPEGCRVYEVSQEQDGRIWHAVLWLSNDKIVSGKAPTEPRARAAAALRAIAEETTDDR